MKKLIAFKILLCISINASAIQLICESGQRETAGRAMRVYKFDSKMGAMERFAYIPSKNGLRSSAN